MSNLPPKFRPGDQVRVCSERDRLGVVWQDGRRLGGEYWYAVLFGAERQTLPESNLEAYQAERDSDSLLAEGVFGNRETFAKCVTFRKLQQPLKNALYSFRASRTQFHPHQYKPLLKFLDSPRHRLLIADEVGLGKTIEAGYILQEMKARGHGYLRRVLIVCPSALCRKWQDELQRRFDEDFTILNAQGFREFLGRVERRGDRAELHGICSIQSLRGRSLLDAIDAAALPLDLVIIDEAHHLRNRGTLSNRLGHLLNGLATGGMILLTATPIHLGNENLFNLLQILDPQEFDRFDVFEQRLHANEIILVAERVLRGTGNLAKCKTELRKVEQTSERRRFLGNPIYESIWRRRCRCR